MKRLLLLASILSFSICHGQTRTEDFTAANGAIEWGNDLGSGEAYPVKWSSNSAARIYNSAGTSLKTLQVYGEAWPNHTVNGVVTTSYQDFQEKVSSTASGGSPTNSAGIHIAPMPYEQAVIEGLISGRSVVDKFGANSSITLGSAPEEIWDGSGPYVWDSWGTAPIAYLSSSSILDVNQTIFIQGLKIDSTLCSQYAVTTGQSLVTLDTPLVRVWRMINVSLEGVGDDIQGVLYCHTDPTPTNGVPSAIAVRSLIDGTVAQVWNQTRNAFYTIPLGYVGILKRGEIMVGLDGNAGALAENVTVGYSARRVGMLWASKKDVKLMIGGAPVYQDLRPYPDPIPALTDLALMVYATTAEVSASATFHLELVEESQFSNEYLKSIGQPNY